MGSLSSVHGSVPPVAPGTNPARLPPARLLLKPLRVVYGFPLEVIAAPPASFRAAAAPASVPAEAEAAERRREVAHVARMEGRVVMAEFASFALLHTYAPHPGHHNWHQTKPSYRRLALRSAAGGWDECVRRWVQLLQRSGKAVLLSGDLNVSHREIDNRECPDTHKPELRRCFSALLVRAATLTTPVSLSLSLSLSLIRNASHSKRLSFETPCSTPLGVCS